MSHPKRKDLFDAWAKAMVAGATVDKPNYGKSSRAKPARKGSHRKRKKRRKKQSEDAT